MTCTNRNEDAGVSAGAVQLGAAALLGGGFYYGFMKQHRIARKEMATGSTPVTRRAHDGEFKRVRTATFLERHLGLDRPQNAGSAAFRALLGGTIVSVTGFAVLVFAAGAVLGVRNVGEFRHKLEMSLPRVHDSMTEAMRIEQAPRPTGFSSEEEEMAHIASIFEEGMKEPAPASQSDALSSRQARD